MQRQDNLELKISTIWERSSQLIDKIDSIEETRLATLSDATALYHVNFDLIADFYWAMTPPQNLGGSCKSFGADKLV